MHGRSAGCREVPWDDRTGCNSHVLYRRTGPPRGGQIESGAASTARRVNGRRDAAGVQYLLAWRSRTCPAATGRTVGLTREPEVQRCKDAARVTEEGGSWHRGRTLGEVVYLGSLREQGNRGPGNGKGTDVCM